MKTSIRAAVAALMLLAFAASSDAVPPIVNYQGRLTRPDGSPLDTTVTLIFTIYIDSLGGTSLWSESHDGMVINNGLFHVLLGSVSPLGQGVFDGSKRWLGVQMQGGPLSSPLAPIVSVAYSLHSLESDTANFARAVSGTGGGWTDDGAVVRLSTSTDNVGIGTSSPANKLEVRNSNGAGAAALVSNDNAANSDPALWVETDGNAAAVLGSSAFKYGLHGSSANSNGVYGTGSRGVCGLNPSSNNYGYLGSGSYGAFGKDTSSGNYGGLGGDNVGVYGNAVNASSYGVFGYNTSHGIGVMGGSADSMGVYGSSANKYGVYGTGSRGVCGFHPGSNHYGFLGSGSFGVFGKDSTTGVWGAIGGGNAGVYGEGNSTSRYGLYGYNNGGGIGILGGSADSIAIHGASASDIGVYGTGTKGVFGYHPSSRHYGFLGSQSFGVFGKDSTTGVWGAIGGGNAGVYGEAQNASHNGVYGYNSGGGVGVRGGSVDSCGVHGSSAFDHGVLGTGTRGVYGLYLTNGNYGYLGSSKYGAYGEYKDSSNWGALGGVYFGLESYSAHGYGVYSKSYSGVGVYGFSNDGTGVFADGGGGDGLYARATEGSGRYAGLFFGPVKMTYYYNSTSDATLEVDGNTLLSKNDGQLTLSTPTQNDPGRYRIKFDNNELGVFCGSDFANQNFAFMTTWGANRAYDAHLKVHGRASGSWGKYIELYHNGVDGYVTTDAGHLILSPASNVGVGTAPTEKLDVNGTARLRGISSGSGTTVVADANGVLHKTVSSERYKTKIRELDADPEAILQLAPVRFNWKETGEEDVGLIAEQVDKAVPDLVIYDREGKPDAVKYDKVAVYLLELVRTQQQEIDSLRTAVEELRSGKR